MGDDQLTWVVGSGSMFGYALGLSDVRVTLADGTEVDCLQKIYSVGPYLAAAFAGSVAIGFGMVQGLRRGLHEPDESRAFVPQEVAEWLPENARKLFAAYPPEEQNGQSHIMLLGVHPTEHNGNPAWARTDVFTFRSPDFTPVRAKPHEVLAIGSGAWIPPFQTSLRALSENNDARMKLMQGEVGRIGGMGTMLAIRITELVRQHQPRGISSHLHLCYVFPGRTVIRTNDHRRDGPWSAWGLGPDVELPEDANFKMPGIASSPEEFEQLLANRGRSAQGAIT